MRRHFSGLLAASVLVASALVVPALSSAGASPSAHAIAHPHAALLARPVKGIAIALGTANGISDARAMLIANSLMSTIANTFHANAVSLNFPYWQSSSESNLPTRAPMTSSPQRLMAITAIAHHYHLRVQWRPYLFEGTLKPSHSHNSIKPTNAQLWLQNYWRFLQPYLEAANLSGVFSFSIALELRSMLPYLSEWTGIVQHARALFSGQLLYSQQHQPQVTLPLTARGYDAYQPIVLPSPSDVSVAAFTRGFEHNMRVAEMNQTPADLTLEEVGIPAQKTAYLRPSVFHYPVGTKAVRRVQVDWFTGACNAFYQLHMQGIYFYSIYFNKFTPKEDQSASIYGWLGTASARAIAQCFARTPSTPAASISPSQDRGARPSSASAVRARATPTVAWSAAQPLEPTGGHPTSISCPTSTFCAEVDLAGNVLTETSGTWSAPVNVDASGLVSVSCASATFCVAVDRAGSALSFDGTTWTTTTGVDTVPMTSVSCAPGSTTCIAGDVAGDVLTLSSGTWSAPSPLAGSPVSAVSCASTSLCVAVDDSGYAHTFTGTWSAPKSLGGWALTSVACPTTTLCVAGNDAGTLFRDANGVWSMHRNVLPAGVASVSCASASSCVALGATSTATATKTASTWKRAATDSLGDAGLSVSCVALGACTAISTAGRVAVHTSTWGPAAANDARHGNLTGVSCSSTTFCVAVDDAGKAMVWDGTAWSQPGATGLAALSGISCSGAFCVAVSASGRLVEYSGGAWQPPIGADANALTAVSCASSTFCGVTDAANHVLTFNGLTWSTPTTKGVSQKMVRGYTAISCAAPAFCVAVDTDGSELVFGTGVTTPYLRQADTRFVPLTGVACASSSLCVAVDEQGRAITYTSSGTNQTWSPPRRIDFYRLTSVACASNGLCLAADDNGGTVAFENGTWGHASYTVPIGAIGAVTCGDPVTCVATDATNVAVGTATL